VNEFGYTGRYLDKETGLWYFRARYYSGNLGRFLSRDNLEFVVLPEKDFFHEMALSVYEQEDDEGYVERRMSTAAVAEPAEDVIKKANQVIPSGNYKDGMSFYAGYFVPNKLDPSGHLSKWPGKEEDCDIKERDEKLCREAYRRCIRNCIRFRHPALIVACMGVCWWGFQECMW